jgi:type IV pilus assembly protein PilM
VFGNKNRLLGIDISSSSVKLVELSLRGTQPCIEAVALEPLPEGAMEDRQPVDIDIVAAAVRRACKNAGSRLKHAAVAVPTSGVIVRSIALSADYTGPELEAAVEVESAQYIPYPLEEVYLDFHQRGISKNVRNVQDVVVVATRREYVDIREEIVREAGLKLDVVDVEAYALENVFATLSRHLYFADAQDNDLTARLDNLRTAMVDVGVTSTSFYVLQGEQMIFTREQSIGCDQLTQSIAATYDLPKDRAEWAKLSGELPEDYPQRVLSPFRDAVAEQVANALQFFFSSSNYTSVDGMMLLGGGGLVPELNKIIAKRVGIPVVVANPFETMEYAKRGNAMRAMRDAPLFHVACGLALRGLDR